MVFNFCTVYNVSAQPWCVGGPTTSKNKQSMLILIFILLFFICKKYLCNVALRSLYMLLVRGLGKSRPMRLFCQNHCKQNEHRYYKCCHSSNAINRNKVYQLRSSKSRIFLVANQSVNSYFI